MNVRRDRISSGLARTRFPVRPSTPEGTWEWRLSYPWAQRSADSVLAAGYSGHLARRFPSSSISIQGFQGLDSLGYPPSVRQAGVFARHKANPASIVAIIRRLAFRNYQGSLVNSNPSRCGFTLLIRKTAPTEFSLKTKVSDFLRSRTIFTIESTWPNQIYLKQTLSLVP